MEPLEIARVNFFFQSQPESEGYLHLSFPLYLQADPYLRLFLNKWWWTSKPSTDIDIKLCSESSLIGFSSIYKPKQITDSLEHRQVNTKQCKVTNERYKRLRAVFMRHLSLIWFKLCKTFMATLFLSKYFTSMHLTVLLLAFRFFLNSLE